jgi:valyl-tRNA synthetase
LYRILQLLAPVTPHITEEIYQHMYAEHVGVKSIHITPWPEADPAKIDEGAEKAGDLLVALIAEIRRDKAEKRKPLNALIKLVRVYAGNAENAKIIEKNMEDVVGTCKISRLEVLPKKAKEDSAPIPRIKLHSPIRLNPPPTSILR